MQVLGGSFKFFHGETNLRFEFPMNLFFDVLFIHSNLHDQIIVEACYFQSCNSKSHIWEVPIPTKKAHDVMQILFQIEEELDCISSSNSRKESDHQHSSPLSIFDASFSNQCCNSSESSGSTDGKILPSN